MTTTFTKAVQLHVDAAYPILYVQTHEEDRCLEALLGAAKLCDAAATYRWSSVAGGWRPVASKRLESPVATESAVAAVAKVASEQMPGDSLYVLLDFHNHLNAATTRAIRDALPVLKAKRKTLVLVSPVLSVPAELEKEVSLVPFDLPTRGDLAAILSKAVADAASDGGASPELTAEEAVVGASAGLTASEAESAFALALAKHGAFDAAAAATIRDEKASAIRRSGLLRWVTPSVAFGDVGDLGRAKAWVRRIAPAFHSPERAKEFGLLDEDFPRSVAFVGIPGCGKSMLVEAMAAALGIGCVQTDFGRLFSAGGGKVGAAEGNVEARNRLVEAQAAVLDWWDEAEKGLSGAGGASTANPWEARVGGSMLTWMETYRVPVLVAATINRHGLLPPEMLSRFQKTFFVGLPGFAGRAEILSLHLGKRRVALPGDGVSDVAQETAGFSGRELRNAVQSEMQAAFASGRRPSRDGLLAAVREITPLSRSRKDELDAIVGWAKDNNVEDASGADPCAEPEPARRAVVRRKGA